MPGTIMIPEKTLADYLCYVFAGFWNRGFRKMNVLNRRGKRLKNNMNMLRKTPKRIRRYFLDPAIAYAADA
ncbi:MAG: creatininase family protein [Treponema sp.]|jgi:creatinine amidohydrolase/Fe(II)-dependent formamide hydrolase-like protein|nr:creatininase family protein [Treponema sp.]